MLISKYVFYLFSKYISNILFIICLLVNTSNNKPNKSASVPRRGGQGPQDFEIWHFLINFFAKKSCFLSFEWWKWNFATFGPICKNIFGQPLDISVGAGKFLGMRRIFPRSHPNLPEKFCVTFANKFSLIKNPFGVTSKNRIHVFFCKRWAPFLPRFSEILSGFQQIKTFGGSLSPPATHLLHHWSWKIHF